MDDGAELTRRARAQHDLDLQPTRAAEIARGLESAAELMRRHRGRLRFDDAPFDWERAVRRQARGGR